MGIQEWNSVFVLIGGRVVCSGCMTAQLLTESEKSFPHSPGCKHDDDETQHPWQTLHELLDAERG